MGEATAEERPAWSRGRGPTTSPHSRGHAAEPRTVGWLGFPSRSSLSRGEDRANFDSSGPHLLGVAASLPVYFQSLLRRCPKAPPLPGGMAIFPSLLLPLQSEGAGSKLPHEAVASEGATRYSKPGFGAGGGDKPAPWKTTTSPPVLP